MHLGIATHILSACLCAHSHKPVAYTFNLTCVCTYIRMLTSHLWPCPMYSPSHECAHILYTQPHTHVFILMYTLQPVHDLRHKRHIEKCCPASGTGSKRYKTGVGYQQLWDNFPDLKYSEDNAVFSIQCDFQSLSSIAVYQALPCAPP